jgi:hypothetical protein
MTYPGAYPVLTGTDQLSPVTQTPSILPRKRYLSSSTLDVELNRGDATDV